jgi:hypothetical protein
MIKNMFFLSLLFIASALYPQDISKIKTDLENMLLSGSRPISLGKEYYIISQGSLSTTQSWTDFAISGKGFFVLLDKSMDRILLSRNGAFAFDLEGNLINHDGFYVLHANSDVNNNISLFIKREDMKERYCPDNSGKMPFIPLDNIESHRLEGYISPFLLLEPKEYADANIISPEYLICQNYSPCKASYVINYALENMPIAFDVLIRLAMRYFDGIETTRQQKDDLVEVIERQYYKLLQNNYIDTGYLENLELLIIKLKKSIYGN